MSQACLPLTLFALLCACAHPPTIDATQPPKHHPATRPLQAIEVLALGEPSHGDGATFVAKAELIQHLHARHDFDVLLFEAPLDRCPSDAQEHVLDCIPPIWSRSAQLEPLRVYLNNEGKTLKVGSFDSKHFHDPAHLGRLIREELRKLESQHEGFPADTILAHITPVLDALGDRSSPFQLSKNLQQDISMARDLLDERASCLSSRCTIQELSYAQLLLENLDTSARVAHTLHELLAIHGEQLEALAPAHLLINARDAQMARNVLWLKHHRYAGQKILLWTANLHAARNPATAIAGERYRDVLTMGDHLASALGDAYAAVGFTASSGHHGLPWQKEPRPISSPDEESIEAQLPCTTQPLSSIEPLTQLAQLTAEDDTMKTGLFFGYEPATARWSDVFSLAFCHAQMTPSTLADQE